MDETQDKMMKGNKNDKTNLIERNRARSRVILEQILVKSDKHSKYCSSTAYSRTEPKEWQPSSSTDSQCAIPTSSRDTPKKENWTATSFKKKNDSDDNHMQLEETTELYNGFTKARTSPSNVVGIADRLSTTLDSNRGLGTYKEVKSIKDNHLYDCGLVVNPGFSFLGATPDGKLCSNGTTEIIEIKCPYAVRDLYIEEAVVTAKWSQRRYCGTIVTENIIERSRIVNQLRSTYSTISEDEDVYSCDYEDIREVSNDSGFLEPEPITSLSPASDVIKKCYSSLSKD
ncbi:unnamed protein product [Mytilus edulis]|uniref:YqaJ viral recombinase domain-containing protein n=1 Tax=Mytilus edulis TaxID=6550 RepID=A0A8S3T817_MYTED|nr:unnamed protein product [Mytilus edulis]